MEDVNTVVRTVMQSLSSVVWKISGKGEKSYEGKVYHEDHQFAFDESLRLMRLADDVLKDVK